jgi:4-hydroxybenzoate polyprenyltransferase
VAASVEMAVSRHGSSPFREVVRFTRIHEWHAGKLPLVLAFALTLQLAAPASGHKFLWLVASYVLAGLFLASAYMLNNVSDATQDRISNKRVGLEQWTLAKRTIPIVSCVALGFGLGLALLPPLAFGAMAACYALAWTYSFPPRFKEDIVLGPLVAAFAQIPAPALTLAAAWGSLPQVAVAYLLVAFLYGLRMILVHQILDHDNDHLTKTRTTATQLGVANARRLLRVTFAIEILSTMIFLILVLKTKMIPTPLLAVLLWPSVPAVVRWRRGEPFRLDSYRYIPLADLHESLIPLVLAVTATLREPSMLGAVALITLVFFDRHLDRLVRPMIRQDASYA